MSRAEQAFARVSAALAQAEADRDALLGAAGFKPGPLKDKARDVILGDIAGMRPAMVAARRKAADVESTAMLWELFVAEGGLNGGLLLRLWNMVRAYRSALTASAATKFVHIGEFKIRVAFPADPDEVEEDDDPGEPVWRDVPVPWDTVKEIMAAIRADAESDIARITGR